MYTERLSRDFQISGVNTLDKTIDNDTAPSFNKIKTNITLYKDYYKKMNDLLIQNTDNNTVILPHKF